MNAVNDPAVLAGVAGGSIAEDKGGMIVTAVPHAEGFENLFFQDVFVFFAGSFFNDVTEESVPGIAVVKFFAGSEFEGLVFESFDGGFDGRGQAFVLEVIRKACEAGNAGGMRE